MWLSFDETRLIKWEDKLKHLNQKLSSALMGVSDKDELIRIHSTFAQAAVSGIIQLWTARNFSELILIC